MRAWRNLIDPLLAGAAWALLAIGSVAMRDQLGGVLIMWAPSGVVVAAFHATRRKRWPLLCLVLYPCQVIGITLSGTGLGDALAYSAASLVQGFVAAAIGIRILGGRKELPRRFGHVVGVFMAALVGCLAGALIAMPFRAEHTLADIGWWFMANVLGILVLTPIILLLREGLSPNRHGNAHRVAVGVTLPLLGCALLGFVALQVREIALMPLLVAAMVFTTVRHGQVASSLVILTYVAVSTGFSIGGGSPAPFLPVSPAAATLVVQSWMLCLLATALPIAAMLLNRDKLQGELEQRNAQMRESLMLFDLAEEVAGIGRWRLDLVTGAQDWSPKMLELNGLSRRLAPDPGNVRQLLPDSGEQLFEQIAAHREARSPFSFTYRVKPPGEPERILRISILNEFDEDGRRVAVFGVAMDVTEQICREEALDLARGRAVELAAEAQKLANTDVLTGLPNRRYTYVRLATLVEVANKRGGELAAVMFDIDHFKRVNDCFGHQTGDEVLAQVAELARRQARSGDVVGRLGGEEFVWLLPGIRAEGSRKLAERLRQSVARGIDGSILPDVTISVGLAQFRRGDSGDTLLARADAALYEAKEGGRNRVKRAA